MKLPVVLFVLAACLLGGACVTINEPCGCPVGTGGSGGASGTSTATGVGGSGGVAACLSPLCGDALANVSLVPTLCGASGALYDSLAACGCSGACAAECADADAGACHALDDIGSTDCKTCLVDPAGCGAVWNACLNDAPIDMSTTTATSTASASSSASTGPGCLCDPALPTCTEVQWQCFDPGLDVFSDCAPGQFCAPCCDPFDCGTHGLCADDTGMGGAGGGASARASSSSGT